MNSKMDFKERLDKILYDFGEGSQEGVKSALRMCQDEFDCVSVAHQNQIAQAFSVNLNIVKTFMKLNKTLKESSVEHEIVCCTGPRCSNNGSLAVLNAIVQELKISPNQITDDKKISLNTQNCFKKCKMGPNIKVDEKFYHHMDETKAKELIKQIKADKSKNK